MYEELFDQIIKASRNNALTFFVGAGLSVLSGAPSWNQLVDCVCEKLGEEKKGKYPSDELLKYPQMLYYQMADKSEYSKFIEDFIDKKDLKPNVIHKMMLDLEPVSFITTNYDDLIVDAARVNCRIYKTVACDKEVPSIFGDRFILKMHGDFKHDFLC